MAAEVNKTNKFCGTCQYWTGERSLSVNKNVKVESTGIKGVCTKWKNERQPTSTRCGYWEKWEMLP